jgi:hypothetical protein
VNTWAAIDRFLDQAIPATLSAESITNARAHGIHLLVARQWQAAGRTLPPELIGDEQSAAFIHLAVQSLLHRIVRVLDEPVLLLKGPEVAAHYPDPTMRVFGDIDLLVSDTATAQAALLAAGFELIEDVEFDHHGYPLRWSSLPLFIELHRRPSWLSWMTPPSNDQLWANAIPSSLGIPGVMTIPPIWHALLLAAHSWRHVPLRRLIDLVDITVMMQDADRDEATRLAHEWGIGPVWTTTLGAIDNLFPAQGADPGRSWSLRLWARHLRAVRDRTVAEKHLARWLGAFWAPTPARKLQALKATIGEDVTPLRGEPRMVKVQRVYRAIVDALRPATARSRDS